MHILAGNKNNIFTWAFNAAAKTLSISNNTCYDMQFGDLLSVYDVTTAAAFNFENMTPDSMVRTLDTNGLPKYTWTFDQVPAGAANGDTLTIMLNCPDMVLNYSVLLYIAGATI